MALKINTYFGKVLYLKDNTGGNFWRRFDYYLDRQWYIDFRYGILLRY